jgi:hypothetical protein
MFLHLKGTQVKSLNLLIRNETNFLPCRQATSLRITQMFRGHRMHNSPLFKLTSFNNKVPPHLSSLSFRCRAQLKSQFFQLRISNPICINSRLGRSLIKANRNFKQLKRNQLSTSPLSSSPTRPNSSPLNFRLDSLSLELNRCSFSPSPIYSNNKRR